MKTLIVSLMMLLNISFLKAQALTQEGIPVFELIIENEFFVKLNDYRKSDGLNPLKEDCFMKEISRMNTERIVNNDSLCYGNCRFDSYNDKKDAFHYQGSQRADILFFDSINNKDYKEYAAYGEITGAIVRELVGNNKLKFSSIFFRGFKNSKDHNAAMIDPDYEYVGIKFSIKIDKNGEYLMSINACFSYVEKPIASEKK